MVNFKRLKLEEARQLAEKWIPLLEKCCCRRADVVAGVYRGKPETSDVDLICEVSCLPCLRALNPVKEDKIRIVFNDPDEDGNPRKIEVWKADERDYELKKWYRRLAKEKFISLAKKAKEKNLKLSWQRGLLDPNGNVITSKPEEIERILGVGSSG